VRPHRFLLALGVAASSAVLAAGPPALAGVVRVQTFTGTVQIIAVDPGGDAASAGGPGIGGSGTEAVADVDGRLVQLPAGSQAALRSGDRVSITAEVGADGLTVRSVRAVGRAPVSPLPPGLVTPEAVRTPVLGTHTITVLPVYWTAPDSATRSSLTALAAATAAYWSAQSGGGISITPTVRDWARIADPGSCDPAALANSALAANGLPLPVSTFDHVVVYFPARPDCGGWVGLGQIGGSLIWDNGLPLTDVTAHEFGHNLGLGHANTATCTSAGARVTLSATCSVAEYHDYSDVMGGAMGRPTGNLNAALADWLGLATTVTAPACARESVRLAPPGQAGVRAVRVRVPDGWVYAEYRPAVAPDVRRPAWAGVQLRLLPDGSYPASRLLDAQPGKPEPFTATSLPPGASWAVPGAGLTLTVASVDPSGAQLTVAPTASDVATPPPVITAPAAHSLVGASATVRWRLASASAVRVLVDGTARAISTAPARSGSAVVNGLSDGPHLLTAQAVNAAGTPGPSSAAVAVTVDANPPSTPTGLTMTSTGVLEWRAATDTGSGVAGYLVALDGGAPVRVGTATSAGVRTPAGRHVWWVAAFYRAGAVSPAAGLVVVRSTSARTGTVTIRVSGPAADVPRSLTTARTIAGTRTF
jgi:hypothetical protein